MRHWQPCCTKSPYVGRGGIFLRDLEDGVEIRFCHLDYGEKLFDAMAHSDDANARRRTFSGNNRETGRRRGTVRERKGKRERESGIK